MSHLEWLTPSVYLLSSILFILGLKQLGTPRTARTGNLLSFMGMLLAIVVTLLDKQILSYQFIFLGLVIGGGIGLTLAQKVKMILMPQMVALFNGFGGLASALIAISEHYSTSSTATHSLFLHSALILSVSIGTITFSGSFIACAKLQGIITSRPVLYPLQKSMNFIILVMIVVFCYHSLIEQSNLMYFMGITVLSFILGITFVLPIGGADMPVIVSLLNSYSGIAVSMTGFALGNYVLIVVGTLVGASGIILTNIMCKGMNRTLSSVLFSGFGSVQLGAGSGVGHEQKPTKVSSPEEMAMLLEIAGSVIIVPGYGLAVSQAQYIVKKLHHLLVQKDISVKFAIHPVAGRMPGHMNVLLAEANIDYEYLYDMDQINDEFSNTDVVIVIGANDVVNPAAKEDKDSPIYGMPILNVDQAKTAFILKRSMATGFAGIDNHLFYKPNTMMVFGDAKQTLDQLVVALA